jgi:hypothetical protein
VNAAGGESPRVKLLAVICEPSAVRMVEILKPDGGKVRKWIKGDLLLKDWWRGSVGGRFSGSVDALADVN